MPPKRRLSETSDGQESLGTEEEAGPNIGTEEEERVKAGPGRPKKKKVDPSQQLQVILIFEEVMYIAARASALPLMIACVVGV